MLLYSHSVLKYRRQTYLSFNDMSDEFVVAVTVHCDYQSLMSTALYDIFEIYHYISLAGEVRKPLNKVAL